MLRINTSGTLRLLSRSVIELPVSPETHTDRSRSGYFEIALEKPLIVLGLERPGEARIEEELTPSNNSLIR